MAVQNLEISDRVKVILDHRHDYYDRSQIPTRRPFYEAAFEEYADQGRNVQIAMGFKRFLAEKKILICEHDILAGFAYRYTYKPSFPFNLPDDYDPLYRPPAGIDTFEEAEDAIVANGFADDSVEAKEMRTFAKCISKWFYKHWETGHIIPGYEMLINTGFGGLIEETRRQLADADESRKPALRAMLVCAEAGSDYIGRYADFAADLAGKTVNPAYKAQLVRMEGALRRISRGPARTFYEAVQLIWLAHEMLYAENFPASLSFGRMDQYLYPFYQSDIEAGRLTRAEAVDIFDALWIKFGITLHGYQNITIGGLNAQGEYASNDLTIMMLQSSRKTLFDQPLLCLRYHESMPDDVWEESVALLRTGIGLPAIFIDDFCINAKKRMGHTPEDAREYGLVGCVEMACPGKEYAKTEALRINTGKILEIMFFNGKSNCLGSTGIIGNAVDQSLKVADDNAEDYTYPLFTGYRIGSIHSFRDMLDWYKEELKAHLVYTMTSINRLDSALPKCYPTPFLSVLIDGCIRNGKDVTAGGAKYNNTGVNLCGLPNVADSLAAVQKLVFEDKRYTLADFQEAMKADFEGFDEMLDAIRHDCPKFGNDFNAVDDIMAELVAAAESVVEGFGNPRGGHWQMGLYSVEDHVKMGINTGALPDGKRKGEALASAVSPVQGKDVHGPTAAVNSLLKTDLAAATNGMVLDIKFSPSFFDKKSHHQALRMLIQAYAEQGGGEIQFNVVDRATLLDAQAHPEKHKDLVVRVSGFSAYFTSLVKQTQDEIIKRTEHAAV